MAWRYSANIPTYITGKDDNGEPVVLYRVNVFLQQHNQDGSDAASAQSPGTDAAAPFFVLRRYSQFRHLHDQLKSAFPAVMSGKGMAPPPKHPLVLGGLGFGGGGGAGGAEARQREMLERRRAELERWIWRLIGSPEIAGSPQFKSFLEFDRALARAQQQQRRKLEAQRSSFSPGSTAGGPAGSGPPSEAGFGHTGGYPAGGGLDDSASDASGPSMAGGVSLGGASTSTSTVVPAAVLGAALGVPAGADGGLRDGDGGRQHQRGSATHAAAGTRGSPAGRPPPGSNAASSLHPHAPDAPDAVQHQRLSHPSLASSSQHPVAGSGVAAAGGGGGGGAVSVTGAVGMGSMAGLPTQAAAAAAAAGGAAAPATAATPGLLRLGIHLHSRSDVRRLVELLVARLETACTDAATASEEAVLLRDANRAMAERLGELESEVAGGGAAAQVRAVLVEAEAARAAAEQRAAQLADSLASRTTAHEHQVAALQAQLAEARAENAEMLKRLADWGVGGPPPASVAAGGGGSSGPVSGGGAAGGDGGAEATALRQRMEELQAELGRREGETAERAAEAEALQARVRQLDEQLAAEAKRREQAEAAAKAAAAAAATQPPPPPAAAPQNSAALDRARADNALLAQEVQRLRGVLAAEREAHKAAATTQAQTAAALQARVKELERAVAASGLGAGAGPAAGFGNGDSLI